MGFWSKLFGGGKKPNETKNRPVQKPPTVKESVSSNPPIVDVRNEDERMNWGIEKAKLTLNYFRTCLQKPKPGQGYFSVKVRFEDRGMVEHIWLNNPHFDEDGNLFGVVGNQPRDVQNVKLNQKVGVDDSMVSDWMIVQNGILIGGYTIRAIRDGLPAAKRPNFDKSLGGIRVTDGEDHFDLDRNTPEGAILALEDAYDHKNMELVLQFKNFKKEAEVMLSSKGIPVNEDLLNATAEALELSFRKWFQDSGFPSFKNVSRAYPIRKKINDNHFVITEVCNYPDGSRNVQNLHTYKMEDGWVVGAPAKD